MFYLIEGGRETRRQLTHLLRSIINPHFITVFSRRAIGGKQNKKEDDISNIFEIKFTRKNFLVVFVIEIGLGYVIREGLSEILLIDRSLRR